MKWYLEDKGNEVFILCGEQVDWQRKIYPDPEGKSKVELYILYNSANKNIGYSLKYKYDEPYPKFTTFNSFGIVYNKKKPSTRNFDVIFEDQIIRLVAWQHQKARDYFLVGRWRSHKEELKNE